MEKERKNITKLSSEEIEKLLGVTKEQMESGVAIGNEPDWLKTDRLKSAKLICATFIKLEEIFPTAIVKFEPNRQQYTGDVANPVNAKVISLRNKVETNLKLEQTDPEYTTGWLEADITFGPNVVDYDKISSTIGVFWPGHSKKDCNNAVSPSGAVSFSSQFLALSTKICDAEQILKSLQEKLEWVWFENFVEEQAREFGKERMYKEVSRVISGLDSLNNRGWLYQNNTQQAELIPTYSQHKPTTFPHYNLDSFIMHGFKF